MPRAEGRGSQRTGCPVGQPDEEQDEPERDDVEQGPVVQAIARVDRRVERGGEQQQRGVDGREEREERRVPCRSARAFRYRVTRTIGATATGTTAT